MDLTSTHFRYLLVIYQLSQVRPAVSSAGVAGTLRVSRPSVTRMLSILAEKDLVTKERYGKIALTLMIAESRTECLIREKVVTFRMVKLNLLLSIFCITKWVTHFYFYHYMGCQRIPIIPN